MKPLATSLPAAGSAAKLAFADCDTACARSGARLTLAFHSGDAHIPTSNSYRSTTIGGKGTASGIFVTTVAQAAR